MVATKSVKQNNKVTVTGDSSLYYSSLAKTYADEAKIAESNITGLLEGEELSTINNNMEAINALVQNISGIKQVSKNMGVINSIKNDTERLFNEIKQVGFYRKGKHLYYKDDEGNEVQFKSNSFVLGTIYQVTGKIDESENLFRYANGQVVIEDDSIKGLTAFLDEQEKLGNTSIFCTEEEWQAEKTLSKFGQCGKYVRDKEAGTLRLPAIVNLQGIMDLTNVGVTKGESLPNIKGSVGGVRRTDNLQEPTDSALYWNKQDYVQKAVETAGTASADIAIDLSRNNSTYQDNAPVQQEAIQYPYVICVNTGAAEEPERPINNYMVNNPFSFGMSQYYKGEMNNLSWLRSNGQKNYKTVYPDFYNWALGQLNAGVEGFKNHTDENITDYDFVINQSDESFILPLKAERILIDKKEATADDPSWYNLYSDGWCEQGGRFYGTKNTFVNYLKNYKDNTTPNIQVTVWSSDGLVTTCFANPKTNGFTITSSYNGNDLIVYWRAEGYINLSTIPSDYNLYYYVGETVQNSNLINAARIEEKLVDKTDYAQAARASTPSKKYINLTIGATGATYTAPANGWFFFRRTADSSATSLTLKNTTKDYEVETTAAIANPAIILPVAKGDVVTVYWLNKESAHKLRFYYAEGDQ